MIIFLGDVALLSRKLSSQYKAEHPYVFNLEYVVAKSAELVPQINKINLCYEESNFSKIFGRNPIAVSVANNHIFDYQQEGYDRTVSNITEKGIEIIGEEPCWITDNVCLLAYMELGENCGFSLNRENFIKTMGAIRSKKTDARVIVQMHWGVENHPNNSAKQRELAHWIIDQGADLVIGHHPHCIQPVEQYKGKYVFYSLGNTLFGNINHPSHYDEDGKPHRRYRFKWQRWNRKSLAVTYDEIANSVIGVEELYQTRDTLKSRGEEIPLEDITRRYNVACSKIRYVFRKYFLFFISNSFVDGKLFDLEALRSEVKKNG